ncbi:hypothetical protein QNI19_13835 [Cytophagaceae bacterium DM2B3-1]|uniref:DUF4369 domain-containing protein n=1 Tax=Xanthocytophaga flava TaxID=3048013 RepID=A0ABT7CJW7_9BACT|nr:hypothetical protein [Xanthocytophaga flavus]MDJ1469470.1 hypothetical protein [Xanthocytophaga flavus]MDJ1494018.1 hypothetical protein [Xanthocytophaga flavus]
MKNYFLIVALLIAVVAQAKRPVMQTWYVGEITLLNNEVLERELRYDAYTDLIQVKENGTIKVYSARQVSSFAFFDVYSNSKRQFVSLLYTTRFKKSRVFFENIISGELNLIRKARSAGAARRIVEETKDAWFDTHNVYDYYIYTDNQFISTKQFFKEVYERIMVEFKQPLDIFIKSRNININTQFGQFVLINQYNILKNSATVGYF